MEVKKMFLVVRKRTAFALIALVLVLIAAVALVSAGITSEAVGVKRLVPVYSVATEDNKVALTFDASWGADKTEKIMDILEEYGFKATFFLTGIWVDEYPELVKEINDRGHLIGNHSANHKHLNELNAETLQSEIDVTAEKIKAITGYAPTYFRAPFGEYDNKMINALTTRGVQCIQWSVDSLDWKGITAAEITENVVSKLDKGAIVLCHNNSDHITEALPLILLAIKNKGMSAVRLDELVYKEGYTIDSTGKQIKNQ